MIGISTGGHSIMRVGHSGFSAHRLIGSLVVGCMLAAGAALPSQAASAPAMQTNWIRANGVTLRYRLEGKGRDTIVLLHESGMALESWDYVAPGLARDHRVLRYDLRGYGLSQGIKGPVSIDDQTADLRELLKALNITGKVNLVGGAIGGAVALKFAADYPDLTASVIAISPAAYLQGRATQSAPPAGGAGGPPAPAAGAAPPPPSPNMQDVGEGAFPTRLREAHPDRYERFKALEQSSAGSGGTAVMGAVYAVKYAEVLSAIKVPAVIAATSLWIRTPADFKLLADAIPNGRFEVLETGHFAPLASPEMVTALIRKYVK
jgi:3-oxoadipate enol-lactonase